MHNSANEASTTPQELQAKARELYIELRAFSAPQTVVQQCCDAGNALLDVIGRWQNHEVIPKEPEKLSEWVAMAERVIAEGQEFLRKHSDKPEDLNAADLSDLAARFNRP